MCLLITILHRGLEPLRILVSSGAPGTSTVDIKGILKFWGSQTLLCSYI